MMVGVGKELLVAYGLAFATCILGIWLLSTGLAILFRVESYSTYKRRQRQLESLRKRTSGDEITIDTITKPVIDHIFSKFKPSGLQKLEKDLRLIGWDKQFTPEQFKALEFLLRIVGVFILIILSAAGETLFGVIMGGAACIFPRMALNGEVDAVKTKLLSAFPDFVRIVQGYLTIEQPFVTCVENSLKFVGEAWKPILEEFIVLCNTRSVEDALGWLQDEVDIFEVKEFVSMVKLSLEQGGNVRQSFDEQAHKVTEILQDLIRIKIEKRRIMSIAVQAPLLLCCFVVFGLPVFSEFLNMKL